ncbi:MAG: hypothetical protein H0X27_04660 [Caulobacteraceae bacterium]|nr:hypothetical protein [Caulobacteraceae bacterium]
MRWWARAAAFGAFRLLESVEAPTAAILDFNLSDGEVTPLAEHLLARSVHVILHSGVAIPTDLLASHGAMMFCAKPTDCRKLVLTVRQMIDARTANAHEGSP